METVSSIVVIQMMSKELNGSFKEALRQRGLLKHFDVWSGKRAVKNINTTINILGVTSTKIHSSEGIFEECWKIRGTWRGPPKITLRLEETAYNRRLSLPSLPVSSKEAAWEVNFIIPYKYIHRGKFLGTREKVFASSKTKQYKIYH